MWQGGTVGRSTVHARRRIAAMALLTLLGAALVVALDRRGDDEHPQSALGPSVVGGVATAKPFTYVPAQRAAYERAPRSASATCSTPRARGAWWRRRGARRTGGRSSTASPSAHGLDAEHARGDRHARVGRAPRRARLRRPALGRGPDPDPGRDRPEPARPAHRRQGLRAPDARHPARAARAPARGAAPARRRALRPGQGDRGDRALPGLRQGQARARRPRRRLLPHGRGQPAAGADGLRQGHRPLRPALLRLEPAAPRGGVAQAGLAGRRLLDLPVARARGARDHAPVPRRPTALQREAVLQSHKASAEEVLHPPERTPVFGDPFAIGRARASGELRAIDATVLAPYGLQIDPQHGRARRGASSSRRACTARCARRRSRCCRRIGAATRAIGGSAAADRHEHGARQATTSASWPRPTRRRRPPTRCTPPASPSTSPATTAAAPRRWPSSSCSTA